MFVWMDKHPALILFLLETEHYNLAVAPLDHVATFVVYLYECSPGLDNIV